MKLVSLSFPTNYENIKYSRKSLINLIILIFKPAVNVASLCIGWCEPGPPQPHPPHLPSPTSLTCPAPHLFSPPQPPPRFTSVPRPASAHPASPPQPHPVSLPSPKHPQQWPLLQHRSCPSSSQAPAAASPAASAARPLKQLAPRSPAPEAACPPQPGP